MLLGGTAWFETDDEDVASHKWRGLEFEPLRKRGHSKEGRDNDPQVIIALAVTREGTPVRSWIFPGNTADVTTVTKIKDDLRGMKLGRTLFVGDAGTHAAANLEKLSMGAGRYILCLNKDEANRQKWRRAEILKTLEATLKSLKKDHRAQRPAHVPLHAPTHHRPCKALRAVSHDPAGC